MPDQRISVVYVDVSEFEKIRLDELFGHVPTEELLEVLQSLTQDDSRWNERSEHAFVCTLSNGVKLDFVVGEEGYIELTRSSAEHVESRQEQGAREKLRQKVAQVREEANLVVHGVIGRALALALPRVALKEGYEIVSESETVDNDVHVIEKEIRLYVPETI